MGILPGNPIKFDVNRPIVNAIAPGLSIQLSVHRGKFMGDTENDINYGIGNDTEIENHI
ncbi:MAG: hypothetical protein MUF72_06530 [Elainella sp. Prado103]|jgi:hypothetical protein|nr:hypothetical protein [Elainella sp. Prado103]